MVYKPMAVVMFILAALISTGCGRSGESTTYSTADGKPVFSFRVSKIAVPNDGASVLTVELTNLTAQTLQFPHPYVGAGIGDEWGRMYVADLDADGAKAPIGGFRIMKSMIDLAPSETRPIVFRESEDGTATFKGKPVVMLHQIWDGVKDKPISIEEFPWPVGVGLFDKPFKYSF